MHASKLFFLIIALMGGALCVPRFLANHANAEAQAIATQPATTQPSTTQPTTDESTLVGTETIVFLRHGEKPANGLGQLTPQGFNRAIALSKVLPAKFGKPDFLFAPDPSLTRVSEGGSAYCYIRPLATIEPTAISLGMPVQTQFGFSQIAKLNAELTSAKYANALIFIAWEHGYEREAVVQLMKQFGGDSESIPPWHGADYDSLFIVKLARSPGQPPRIAFTHDQEGLDNLSKEMPLPAR